MRPCLAVIALCLSACGAEWKGGLVHVWEPDLPNGSAIVLHDGHRAWQLTDVAEQFQAAGYMVFGVEMQPKPHVRPTVYFTAPVTAALDEIEARGLDAYMVGLSGGGWATTVMTYLDQRIKRGYSVAGDLPLDYQEPSRDHEQLNPPSDYRTMYAAAGDRLIHVYNWDDDCCFARVTGDIGGRYVTDYTHAGHLISAWAVRFILNDIRVES